VHVFALDSDINEPDGTTSASIQGNWLQQELATSSAPWKLVYFHHPPYSSGPHGSTMDMQWPFEAWGATAVLAGHDHTYERIIRNGFPYFVNGLGGSSIYTFGRRPVTGSVVRYNGDYGAMLVDASADTLRFQFITRGGTLVDIYTLYTPAAVPSQLTATPVSNSQIDLAWTDHTTYEAGFSIERSTDGTNFTQDATVGPDVTSYANTGLSDATTYFYRVRAYDNGGASGYSNIASATTPAGVPAPSNLKAIAISESQINLTWIDNASNETAFQIEQLNGTTWSLIATVGSNITSYANTGLAPSTRYSYRVRAWNISGGSSYSNTASARTKHQ
jgi:hypothetical protein